MGASSSANIKKSARIFLNQFEWLKSDSPLRPGAEHDFYRGDHPMWSDILQNLDAPFETTLSLAQQLPDIDVQREHPQPPKFYCLWGPPGSGKSTALLRIAQIASDAGFEVVRFRENEALDVAATREWLKNGPPCLMVFESVADSVYGLRDLILRSRQAGTQFLAVGAERESRIHYVRRGLLDPALVADDSTHFSRLSENDVDSVLDKLSVQGRLGNLARQTRDNQREHFRRGRGQLLPSLYTLTGGLGFRDRIVSEYRRDIQSPTMRDVYAVVCLVHQFGYPLPIGVASTATGVAARDLVNSTAEGGDLYSVVRVEDRGLTSRHRVVASQIVEHALDYDTRRKSLLALAKALSPYISIQAIRAQSLHYKIIRNLMTANVIGDLLGVMNAPRWYEELIDEFGWNSRYWEQRALAELKLPQPNFPKAKSFAQHAVSIEEHHFTLTTLGVVGMRACLEDPALRDADREEALWSAIDALREARRRSRDEDEHAFVTFFTYVLRYGERLTSHRANLPAALSREWNQWVRAADQSAIFRDERLADDLLGWRSKWLQFRI